MRLDLGEMQMNGIIFNATGYEILAVIVQDVINGVQLATAFTKMPEDCIKITYENGLLTGYDEYSLEVHYAGKIDLSPNSVFYKSIYSGEAGLRAYAIFGARDLHAPFPYFTDPHKYSANIPIQAIIRVYDANHDVSVEASSVKRMERYVC